MSDDGTLVVSPLMHSREVAAYLKVSESTLSRWRSAGMGPPFLRLGGLTLGNVPVVFADMPIFKLWELHETPTIMLGIDLLTQFETVAVDFGRSAVRFDIANA